MKKLFQTIIGASSRAPDCCRVFLSGRSLPKKIAVSFTTTRSDVLSKRCQRSLRHVLSSSHWLCGAALIALASPAAAQTINTVPAWGGLSNISPWDTTITETIGQTITPTSGQTKLSSFTFELSRYGGNPGMQYQAFVYQWNGASKSITGPALFTSAVLTAPAGNPYTPVKISTGSLALTAGMQYILFFTTTSVTQVNNGQYQFGSSPSSAYTKGQAYFSGSGSFSSLSSSPLVGIGANLAFIATFGSSGSTTLVPLPPFIPQFTPLLPAATPINPTNVAAALDKFINSGGTLPAGFLNLLAAAPGALVASLSQLSGENNTDAQQGAFELMNSYLSLLTDPYATNRTGSAGGPLGFAPAASNARANDLPNAITSAYASIPGQASPALYEPRWDSWGAAFGGSSTNRGDATVLGSHDSTANVGGLAAGADYRFSPDTLAGFSLAGGETSWNLAGGLGNGSSQAFLAGIYGSHKSGAAYVSGALTYANYWMTTGRSPTVGGADSLQAKFDAQSVGGRLEGGYRIATRWMVDITPYAAVQGQSFHTPAYGEVATGAASNPFALNFDARNATDVRTELGARADRIWPVAGAGSFNVFGKVAWAHDEVSDPRLSASFIGLTPVASFVVNGATPSHDLALLSTGSEWRLGNGVSLMAKFDGELSSRTMTYAGTGRLRYTW